MDDDVLTCVFRKCVECQRDILVLWNEDARLIKTPQSCQEHQT